MKAVLAVAAALGLGLFALAFVVAPRACSGGLGLYFWAGVAATVAAGAAVAALPRGFGPWRRTGLALALMCGVALAWLAGLFAADVRIMCRLF